MRITASIIVFATICICNAVTVVEGASSIRSFGSTSSSNESSPEMFLDVQLPQKNAFRQEGLDIEELARWKDDRKITAFGSYKKPVPGNYREQAFIQCALDIDKNQNELEVLLALRSKLNGDSQQATNPRRHVVRLLHNFTHMYNNVRYICLVLSDGGPTLLAEYAPNYIAPKIRKLTAMLKQVVSSVASLHRNGLVHLNISPSNILVDYEADQRAPIATIRSFAYARWLDVDAYEGKLPSIMVGGDFLAKPPEYFSAGIVDGKAYDAWSIGATFYKACYGWYPFENEYMKLLKTGQTSRYPGMIARLTPDSIQQLLYPRTRLSTVSHKVIPSEFTAILEQLLHPDPEKRRTPEEIVANLNKAQAKPSIRARFIPSLSSSSSH
ncbi:kinase-like domain-containing protein [Syncephalis pseudoplumigaleata]|uniref:Kinase-like domain-containing protein n=1 Tax=Syncephalis pseudoplumigaleata TaxID=1712513 RepID=A0A4P9Z4F8_9FUNG|nr:kinase-like domain-containing protein [Syncephalis pseudoplumigaleata]|eukprot:RKP27467.1 kinase-like domain-containing protein [Syncephalis pseudoplumigaleata]